MIETVVDTALKQASSGSELQLLVEVLAVYGGYKVYHLKN